jgi:hypothetical protein
MTIPYHDPFTTRLFHAVFWLFGLWCLGLAGILLEDKIMGALRAWRQAKQRKAFDLENGNFDEDEAAQP